MQWEICSAGALLHTVNIYSMDAADVKIQLARLARACCASQLLDLSGMEVSEAAIYALSDPRDIALPRYVGQTRSPRRRLLQHINTARLWLPEQRPWWVKSPKLRPLYEWIRELYLDGQRLPVMAVIAWTEARHARLEERNRICEYLGQQLPLLNREAETIGKQILLL
jgi:hypothetical protein